MSALYGIHMVFVPDVGVVNNQVIYFILTQSVILSIGGYHCIPGAIMEAETWRRYWKVI